jgi:xanthine dehydrogenase YagR molybdenum-binding subunit
MSGVMNGTSTAYLGKPTSRVDGHAKVTGVAKYAAEHNVPGLAYGFVVTSAIARGRIRSIHTTDALAVPGVLDIFTHAQRPRLASSDEKYGDEVAPPGSPFRPPYDDQVRFSGQPVALVVAEDPETARFAASLIRIDYDQRTHTTDLEENRGRARAVKENGESHSHRRGNAARAFDRSSTRIEVECRMPVEHHNPMEMFGATAIWEGDGRITVYDKTQGPVNCRNYVANVFGMSQHAVRVLSPYVGGGFGSGLRAQYELPLAVLAARALRRSVQVTLTRQQMFTLGYRAGNIQSLALATDADGKLTSFRHEWIGMTSQFENFQRSYVTWSSQLYKCDNVELVQKLVKLPATCVRRASPKVCLQSNARWMSWPMRQMWTRSRSVS